MYDESAIELVVTPLGLERYRLPANYPPLHKHRNISSDSPEFAVHKAVFQEMLWNAQREQCAAVRRKKLGFEMNAKRPDVTPRQKRKIAEGRTELARQELAHTYKTLANALNQPVKFTWDTLKKFPDYPIPRPGEPDLPPPPDKPALPKEPVFTDVGYKPKLTLMDRIMPSRRRQKVHDARKRFDAAHTQWKQLAQRVQGLCQEQIQRYKEHVQHARESVKHDRDRWEREKERYYREREKCVKIVEAKKVAFTQKDPHAILDYVDMVLAFSNYPPSFPQSYELDFDVKKKLLAVDYLLPPVKILPRLASVTYDKAADTFIESVLEEEERDNNYALLLHEIPLRTLYEIFNADSVNAVAAVQFRGYLYLPQGDKADVMPSCVLSILAERSSFSSITLADCDPIDVYEQMGGTIQSFE